jgi:hypothetical protein
MSIVLFNLEMDGPTTLSNINLAAGSLVNAARFILDRVVGPSNSELKSTVDI